MDEYLRRTNCLNTNLSRGERTHTDASHLISLHRLYQKNAGNPILFPREPSISGVLAFWQPWPATAVLQLTPKRLISSLRFDKAQSLAQSLSSPKPIDNMGISRDFPRLDPDFQSKRPVLTDMTVPYSQCADGSRNQPRSDSKRTP